MIFKYLFKIVVLLLLTLITEGADLKGTVESVTDGDTIKVRSTNGINTIRFYGIDAPEKDQPFGNSVTTFLKDKIENKQVFIEYSSKDRYGRIIGKVYYNGTYINNLIVKIGGAWHYKQYSNDKDLSDSELYAKKNQLGIWKNQSAIAPWEWRKRKK